MTIIMNWLLLPYWIWMLGIFTLPPIFPVKIVRNSNFPLQFSRLSQHWENDRFFSKSGVASIVIKFISANEASKHRQCFLQWVTIDGETENHIPYSPGPKISSDIQYLHAHEIMPLLVTSTHRPNISSDISKTKVDFARDFQCIYVILSGNVKDTAFASANTNDFSRLIKSNKNVYFLVGEEINVRPALKSVLFEAIKFKIGIIVNDEHEMERNPEGKLQILVDKQIMGMGHRHGYYNDLDDEGLINLDLDQVVQQIFKPRNILKNHQLYTAVYAQTPYYQKTHDSKNIGFSYKPVEAIAAACNSTLRNTPMRMIFEQLSNGTWTGVIGEIIAGRVDVVPYVAANPFRFPYIEYGVYCVCIEVTFVTGKPITIVNWRAFQNPFQFQVWISLVILCALLIIIFLLYLLCKSGKNPYYLAALFTISPLLMQTIADSHLLRSLKIRPLIVTWIFSSFLIVNYYNSNLLSHITVPALEQIPRDFKSLAQRKDYTINYLHFPGGTSEVFFRETRAPLYASLSRRLEKKLMLMECLQPAIIPENKVACGGWEHVLVSMIARNFTERGGNIPVVYSKDHAFSDYIHVGVQKNSKYLDDFNEFFSWLRDFGLLQKWMRNAFKYNEERGFLWRKSEEFRKTRLSLLSKSGKEQHPNSERSDSATTCRTEKANPFSLYQLLTAFGAILCGNGIAFVTFLWEKFYLNL